MTDYTLDLIGRMLAEMQGDMRDMKARLGSVEARVEETNRNVLELKERVTRLEFAHARTEDRLIALEVSHDRLGAGIREAVHHLRIEAERR